MRSPTPMSSLLDLGPVFHYLRIPGYWGLLDRLAVELAPRPDERVLDVGCGTGLAARLAPGHYVGVDASLPYLRMTRRWARAATVSVAQTDGAVLPFRDGAFDKAIVVNVVHHLDDDAVDRLLAELRRTVRGDVVLADADPEKANPLEAFLLRHDRGDHIRPHATLRARLARRYRVASEQRFHNAIHTIPQVVFKLSPS